jgi:ribonucleoside-diphosphate reductase beta chain
MLSEKKSHDVISCIRKRDQTIEDFDIEKISAAINKAMIAVGHGTPDDAARVAQQVVNRTAGEMRKKQERGEEVDMCPSVEEIQDIVEETLMANDFFEVAKAYILYRQKRAEERKRDIFKKRVNLKPYQYP